uniref:Uncharacterized protein n=1 Tax=Salix viminalis TaxID=40686 RepID=A0A6N2KTJ5_SALVM
MCRWQKAKDKLPLLLINIATIEIEAFENNRISVNKGLRFEVCSLKKENGSRTTRGFKFKTKPKADSSPR